MGSRIVGRGLEAYREIEFPLSKEWVYLNHAASSPLPRRCYDALCQYGEARVRRSEAYANGNIDYDITHIRTRLGDLLNCDANDVGFVPSTCDGLAAIANSVDWRPGDNVVIPECDFQGVHHAWLNLARRGVEVRSVRMPNGFVEMDALFASVTSKTRAISISHVQMHNGFKIDIGALGQFCRERGIHSVVDAIQSVGVEPIDVTAANIDVLVFGAYKFLMGIPGIAVLYINRRVLDQLHPDRGGKLNVAFSESGAPTWADGPLRYQVGSLNEAALWVLDRSLDLLLTVGVDEIKSHVSSLVNRLDRELRKVGVQVTSSEDP